MKNRQTNNFRSFSFAPLRPHAVVPPAKEQSPLQDNRGDGEDPNHEDSNHDTAISSSSLPPVQERYSIFDATATSSQEPPAEESQKSSIPIPSADHNSKSKMTPDVAALFFDLRKQSLLRLLEFSSVQLFSLVWAFATAKQLDERLYGAVRRRVLEIAVGEDWKHAEKVLSEVGEWGGE